MIVDRLENAARHEERHGGFRAAFDFLRQAHLAELPEGRYAIDGDRLYVILARAQGRGRAGAPLEAHRRYVDIQYVIAGRERIGIRPTADCRVVATPYDAAKDIVFFKDEPTDWIDVPAGAFAVFDPADAHAPLAGEGEVFKAVAKVAVGD